MKKSKPRIFALFLAISLLFAGIPTYAAEVGSSQERASTAQSEMEVGVEVTYNQTGARQMLKRINEFRTGSEAWAWNETDSEKVFYPGLGELVYDYELEKVAMQRAAELVASYSHTRPDGTIAFTAFGSEFDNYMGENIAFGWYGELSNEQQAFTAWKEDGAPYSGQGHRRNMLNKDFTSIGIAQVVYNGNTYWAQAFSGNIVDTKETEPQDGLAEVRMGIANDRIKEKSLQPAENSVSMKVGASKPAPLAHMKLQVVDGLEFQVSDTVSARWEIPAGETRAALEADGSLKALAAGKITVKAVYDGMEADVSITITETAAPAPDADQTVFSTVDGGSRGMYDASRELTIAVFGRASCSSTRNTLKSMDDLGMPSSRVHINYIDIMKDSKENVQRFGAQMATAGVAYCYDSKDPAGDTLWRYAKEYLGASVSQPASLPICVYTDASGKVLKVTESIQGAASLKTLLTSIGYGGLLPSSSALPAIKGLTVEFRSSMYYYPKHYWPFNVTGTQDGDIVEYALAGDNPVYDTIMKKLVHAGTYQILCRVSREGYQTWTRTVTVTVAQIDPEYEIPTGLQGKSGKTLKDVALPTGFSWKNPQTKLKEEGAHSYKAVYTPENTRDYRTADVTIEVKVSCPGHKYTSTVIRKPTKTREGSERLVCSYCGYSYTKKIDKLPADGSGSQTGGGNKNGNASQNNSNKENNSSKNNNSDKNNKKVTPPSKVRLQSVKRIKGTKVRLSWKKVSGASGYEIYMKAGKGKYKKIKTLGKSSVSYTKTRLKKKTSYTFRIRAYKKSGKKKVYGAYSAARRVR